MPDSGTPVGGGKAPWRTIYFRLEAKDAREVALVGDFNDWNARKHVLERNADGVWECHMPLPPGRYTYAFLVDGARHPDPRCERRLRTPEGAEVCVIEVTAPA